MEAGGQWGLCDSKGSATEAISDPGSVTHEHGDGALALLLLGRIKSKDKCGP